MPTDITPFAYESLDTETRSIIQQRTSEIRSLMHRSAQDIINIGQKLSEIRDKLDELSFTRWLAAEFDWSRQTAYRFINVYKRFSGTASTQLDIAPSALYLLAAPSAPEPAREEAIKRASSGERITHRSAQAIVQTHRPAPPSRSVPSPQPDARLLVEEGKLLLVVVEHVENAPTTRQYHLENGIQVGDLVTKLHSLGLLNQVLPAPKPHVSTPTVQSSSRGNCETCEAPWRNHKKCHNCGSLIGKGHKVTNPAIHHGGRPYCERCARVLGLLSGSLVLSEAVH